MSADPHSTPDEPDTAPDEPETTPDGADEQERPELRLVRTDDTTDDTAPDEGGTRVTAQAPLDVRIKEKLSRGVRAVPAFGQVPASFAESWEYSQTGDWASSENGGKRIAHGFATAIAYTLTYPLVEGLGTARTKPIGLLLTVLVLAALARTATAVF